MALRLTNVGLQRSVEYILGITQNELIVPGAWLTLFTTGPSNLGAGDVELAGYARVDLDTWSQSVAWPSDTATLAGGYQVLSMPACSVTGWGISNADFGGDLLAFELYATPVTFSAGDRYSLSPGDIAILVST